MKTINLRTYYYPHYTEDVFVEVSDEVAEVMLLSVREMENYRRRTCRHKAYYSLDAYDWTENYALEHSRPRRICLCFRRNRPPVTGCCPCWTKHSPRSRRCRPAVSAATICGA